MNIMNFLNIELPALQPVQVTLDGSTVLWSFSQSSQFGIISELAEDTSKFKEEGVTATLQGAGEWSISFALALSHRRRMPAESILRWEEQLVQSTLRTNVKQLLVHADIRQLQNILAAHMAVKFVAEDRAHLLEERLSSQERTTAFLLHQAFRIKDDITSYLHGSNGYQQGETAARRLLENHIQTITSIVKKLSQDIEVMHAEEHLSALVVGLYPVVHSALTSVPGTEKYST
ncbi:protein fam81b [Limosa lapponica baueri]|uniref:Protein fam81b n=1 Tax=Limosa lapponica baueri TaxID=1758121 RepID=A0A2I0T9Y5_LIMLA|nr:protein fam81b [Limosa lapponica baueri]